MIRTLFLLLFASGNAVAQVNLNQGLMAYYPFSGNANDSSGNNNNNPVFNNVPLAVSACVPTFQKLYGGNKADFVYHIESNPDGSFVTAGATNSFGSGGYDGYLQKIDKNGNLLWNKTIGGNGNDYLYSIRQTTDGGYITGGVSTSFGGSANGVAWMVKTDGNGNVQWSRKYDDGNTEGSVLYDVINTTDGGYALSGSNRATPVASNGMMIKTDNTGAVVWAKSFDSNNSDGAMSLLEDANSLIVIAYQYGQSSSFYDGVIMKLNISDGSVIWARNYDMESKSNWPRELFKTATGYSFNCYQDVSFAITAPEQVVVNTDLNGNPLSLRKLTSSPTRYGYYVTTPDGGFVTTQAVLTDPNHDIHLVKVTAAGVVQWTRIFGGTGLQHAYDMALSPDGGYLIAAYNNNPAAINDSANIYILKTDSLGNTPGCTTGTAITTVSTPTFTVNPAFVWASVTNLSFSNTSITPVTASPNSFSTTLCPSICQANDSIINDYTPVVSLDKCKNILTVEDGTAFNTGDTVLMIQMKGAVIDSTNTAAFGTITDYKNAGNYEFNYVKSKTGNMIELKNNLTRQYDIPDGKVQLVRVPYYQNKTITTALTCLPWDGSKGGILVLNVQDSVILNANIDVSGKGFRGGNDPFSNPGSFFCNESNYYYPVNPDLASEKGEGIAIISAAKSFGRGDLANGGGGGNSHNSGGGGGSNAAAGGFGGYNFEGSPCTNSPFDNRGIGGTALTYNNATNKIFLGGGGGGGHSNNPEAFLATGGNGSGIVIIMADKLKTNTNKIIANGSNAAACAGTGSGCHEGMGGGGAGGTALLKISNYIDPTVVEIKGGNGGNMTASGFLKVGPGGGGGGGKTWLTNPSLPAGVTVTVSGGQAGVCTAYANDPWGATSGQLGSVLFNLSIPFDNILFKPNIDSVRIKDSITSCSSFDFKGFGYTNTNPVTNWQWDFGDAGTAATQNTNHTYATAGTFTVKLVITDINGCKDSITRNVSTSFLTMDAGPGDTICNSSSTTLQSSASGATQYAWTPATYLNNPAILNPVATPPASTTFYLTATNASGCSQTDSVRIEVRSANGFSVNPPVDICKNATVQLNASGGDIYSWSPAGSLNNAAIPNPVASPANTTPYSVNITDTICGFATSLSTTVTIIPLPNVRAAKSNDIDCSTPQSLLSASGAASYSWLPSGTLNNPNSASTIAKPIITTQYNVTGTDLLGCINYDSIIVKVSKDNAGGYLMPTGFTPNNDGKNDCYGIKYWGTIIQLEFGIYNRWGERIFFTTNPNGCWDGRINGVPQDSNVFVYMIKAKTTCQPEVFRKGTFVLIR